MSQLKDKESIFAYFSCYDINNGNNIHLNKKKKTNNHIEYDNHVITFTSTNGDIHNLKFKNKIKNIFPLSNGILLNLIENSSTIPFFQSKIENEKDKNRNFIITENPLSSISPLPLCFLNDGKIIQQYTFEVIKTSKKFPFIISQKEGSNNLNLSVLLYKQNTKLKDFESNIKKMLNTNFEPFNLGSENPENYPTEYSFKALELFEFENIENNNLQCKMYLSYQDKRSLFVCFLEVNKQNLTIFQLSFSNGTKATVINKFSYSNVKKFKLINNLLFKTKNIIYDIELINKQEKTNIIEDFLLNCTDVDFGSTFYKTLVFLSQDNKLCFVESGEIIFTYEIQDLGWNIENFTIKNEVEFYFYAKENINEYTQINKDFKINDSNVLILIKIINMYFGNNTIGNLLLKCLYKYILLFPSNNLNHFALFSFILVNSLNRNPNFTYIFFTSDQEQNQINLNISFDINLARELINEFQKINVIPFITELVETLKGMFDNMKQYNYYLKTPSMQTIYTLIFNMLISIQNNELLFRYIEYFACYHYLTFDKYFSKTNQLLLSINYEQLRLIPKIKPYSIDDENNKYRYSQLSNITYIIDSNVEDDNIIMNSTSNNKINTFSIFDEEYSLFKLNTILSNENSISKLNENFLTKLIDSKYSITTIKNLNPKFSLSLLSQISRAKNNPYKYLLHSNKNQILNTKLLTLIDRIDLDKNINLTYPQTNSMENLSGMLYKNETSDYDSEYYLSKIKFNNDNRIIEANRILSPIRILKLNSSSLLDNNNNDLSQIENEKFILVYKHLVRQYTSCVGYGAINLNTIKTFPKEILDIKPLNTQCLLTSDESTYNLETNKDSLKDKDFAMWAEFHNGVAQSIKLSTEHFNNKSYIRNWILFNKPSVPSFEHGGFLFGMGLLNQLDSLYATDVYQYMKGAHDGVIAHDGVTIGILLGRSASKISSMEETLSRTLCLHISFLIPSTLEITISMNIQSSAVMGIGLIYMNTGNRLMTEMLLNQIGKISNNNDKSVNMKHLESYNLCLGFAVGLINLGLGNNRTNHDLNYETKLLNLLSNSHDIKKLHNNIEQDINIKQTAPSIYACLTLSYLQSRNSKVASKIPIPQNLYQLDIFRPFHLYLALLTKALIMWDEPYIIPTEEWVYGNIPSFIKFLYENPLSIITDDITYSNKLNLIEFSQISTSYYYSICAGVMALAFKYCGSSNIQIRDIIINILYSKLLKVKVIKELIVRENTKYNDHNKFSLNKVTYDECLCIFSYALSIIMAGSGDLKTFKILRILRKKVDSLDYKHFIPGYTQAINHSIGILFLGSGGLTFNSNKNSLGFIYISTFPIFNRNLNDNEKYLQALRHIYVLACENKIFETRDIKTNEIIRSNVSIEYFNGSCTDVCTPANLGDVDKIKKIYIKNYKGYYDMEIDREEIMKNRTKEIKESNLMQVKVAYIKKRTLFDKETELSIRLIDINNVTSVRDCIDKFKQWSDKQKNVNNGSYSLLCDIVIEQIKNVYEIVSNLRSDNNLLRNFLDIYVKMSFTALVYYVNNDNVLSFYIVNDYLNKFFRCIQTNNWRMFEVFEFFIKLHVEECSDENMQNELTVVFGFIIDEIKMFIKTGLKMAYRECVKGFIDGYGREQEKVMITKIDWNFLQFLKIFGVGYEDLLKVVKVLKEGGDIFKWINEGVTEDFYEFVGFVSDVIKHNG